MKRTLPVLLLLCMLYSLRAEACDVCGCSASNQYLGILPQYSLNFIGFQYQHNTFSATHPSLFENKPDEHSSDIYNTFQVWGRYNIGRRIQVFAFVPYRLNAYTEDGVRSVSSGIGDVSALMNYAILKSDSARGPYKHQLLAGGGLKAPTGSYTGITALDKEGIPNMQPGTGSWDFLVNANYTISKGHWGANADVAYTITLANKENYKYGNRLSSGVLGFYSFTKGKLNLLPQAGLRCEYGLHDYDNYDKRWLNDQSGGYLLYAAAGAQVYYNRLGFRLTGQLPVAQHYGAGYVSAGFKLDAGVFFLF